MVTTENNSRKVMFAELLIKFLFPSLKQLGTIYSGVRLSTIYSGVRLGKIYSGVDVINTLADLGYYIRAYIFVMSE